MKKFLAFIAATVLVLSCFCPSVAAEKLVGSKEVGYKYQFDDGTYATKGWLTVGSRKYYIQSDGTMKTGWMTTTNGTKYYFRTKKTENGGYGEMIKGWLTYDGEKYYFNENGKMVTGNFKVGNKEYFFRDTGELWKTITYEYEYEITTTTVTTVTETTEYAGIPGAAETNTYTTTKTEVTHK